VTFIYYMCYYLLVPLDYEILIKYCTKLYMYRQLLFISVISVKPKVKPITTVHTNYCTH